MKLKEYLAEEETPVGYIGQDEYKIFVYPEPNGNPSFHFRNRTGDTETVFQIKDFKILEQKTRKEFSSKELKRLRKWFGERTKIQGFGERTNWQVLLLSWNMTNQKYQIDPELKIPDRK